MKTAQVTFRTDNATKNRATERAKDEGISITTVLDAFLSAYATGKIHLDISLSAERDSDVLIDEMEDGFGAFGSRERYKAARRDFETKTNIVSWRDIREKMLKIAGS